MNYQILFRSAGNPKITFREVPSSRLIDPALEAACRKSWHEMLAEAAANKRILYDSELYRFESLTATDNRLDISVSTIPFSIRLAMNNHSGLLQRLGRKYASMGMYTSCFVVSADGKYLFIEKSNNFYTNRSIAFVGGVLSKSDMILADNNDLQSMAEMELLEELEVSREAIKDIKLEAIYQSANCNVCLLFRINLSLAADVIIDNFQGGDHSEAAGILAITPADLPRFIKEMPQRDRPKFEIAGLIK